MDYNRHNNCMIARRCLGHSRFYTWVQGRAQVHKEGPFLQRETVAKCFDLVYSSTLSCRSIGFSTTDCVSTMFLSKLTTMSLHNTTATATPTTGVASLSG